MQVKDLLEKVSANIKDSHNTVAERVAAALTEQEVTARTNAFMTVLGKLDESRRNAKKIQPDVVHHPVGADGKVGEAVRSFTPAKLKEQQQNQQEQEKLETALNKALEGDFTKVKELAGKGGAPKPAEEG